MFEGKLREVPEGPIEPKVNFKHQQIIEDFSLKNKITRHVFTY